MERSIVGPSRTTLASLGVFLALGASLAPLRASRRSNSRQEFRQLHTRFDPKHSPKIAAPDCVKRGEWFNVTISVGADATHPSLSEHSSAT